jgi:3-oxoacyl-[acyl-carrier protein] reductase
MAERKTALVTGSTSGIGLGMARALAGEGYDIMLNGFGKDDEIQALVADLRKDAGVRVEHDGADLSQPAQVRTLVHNTVSKLGRVDVLVNNAGFNVNAPALTMKLEDYDAVMSLERGTWYLTKMILRRFMFRKGVGRIINISSVVGHTGNPGQIPYTMAKAGLDAFSKSLAQEMVGKDILVNSIAPGFIDTDMTDELPEEVKAAILARIPQGRMGRADEIADVVAFLATRGSYVNGTVIHVNGGMFGG